MSTKRRWGYVEHDVLGDLDLQLKSCGRELVEIEREQGKVRDAMERNRPYRGISEYLFLMENLRHLWKKEEQLRDKEQLVQEEKLVILKDMKRSASSGVPCRSGLAAKPIILLYPTRALEVSVRLSLREDWKFTTLYPRPSCDEPLQPDRPKGSSPKGPECTWNVGAKPSGCLQDLSTGQEYPYLFWEADSKIANTVPILEFGKTPSFCVAGDKTGLFLNDALTRLGLNMRERCDMITYWLERMEKSPFNVIYFVDQKRLARVAQLNVSPRPDVLIRIFIAFRGLEVYDAELDTAKLWQLHAPPRDGFVVIEWGGMDLKEGNHIA